MATLSSIVVWKMPWREEPVGLWSIVHGVAQSWTRLSMHTLTQGVSSSLIFQFSGTMMVPLAGSTSPLGTKISNAAELKLAGMGSKNSASDCESEKSNPPPPPTLDSWSCVI